MATLQATLVTPLTGPLALYGRACAAALRIWAKSAAQLPAGWNVVELDVRDSEPDLHKALHEALARHPDVFFGPYGSGPMLKVAHSCTRLIWNHGGASSQLARPTFPQVINVLSPASRYFADVLHAIHSSDPTARTVSLLHSSTGFGRDVAIGAIAEAARLHMRAQTVQFKPDHVLEMVERVPNSDILLVVGNFADERAVAPRLLARPWNFRAFVGAGVEEVLASLGKQREGLIGPAQWVASAAPEPDEGPPASWFVKQYLQEEGVAPPYAAAQAFAAGIVYARCLRETTDTLDASIQAAAQMLNVRTLFGRFQIDPLTGAQSGHQIAIVQWQQGQRQVVWPPEQAHHALMSSHPH